MLLAVIPVTVFILQSKTQTQSKAEKATTFCFTASGSSTCLTSATPIPKNIGDTIPFDIYLDPGGKNSIVVATVSIDYDQTILTADPAQGSGIGFTISSVNATAAQGFTQILVDPSYTAGNTSVTLTVGTDALKAITQKQKIASITFKALAQTAGSNITFNDQKSNATSTIDPEVNVLATMQPATVQIAQGTAPSPTTTTAPTAPTATVAPGGTVAPTATTAPVASGTPVPNQLPICTGLNVDRVVSGPAPFSITFTANGNDPDANGTISNVTFDFGDGPVQTVTTGGGIGTRSVSIAVSHTYNNPTTFTAKATLTDNHGGLSIASSSCTQTITVTAPAGGIGGITPSPTLIAEAPTATPLPKKIFNGPPGPSDTFIGIGIAGAVITTIGAIILFAL